MGLRMQRSSNVIRSNEGHRKECSQPDGYQGPGLSEAKSVRVISRKLISSCLQLPLPRHRSDPHSPFSSSCPQLCPHQPSRSIGHDARLFSSIITVTPVIFKSCPRRQGIKQDSKRQTLLPLFCLLPCLF